MGDAFRHDGRREGHRDGSDTRIDRAKTSTPTACTCCAGTALIRRLTTYPVRLTGPAPLTGKEIHVHRRGLHACLSCGHLMPTPAGHAKVERCVARGIELFLGLLP